MANKDKLVAANKKDTEAFVTDFNKNNKGVKASVADPYYSSPTGLYPYVYNILNKLQGVYLEAPVRDNTVKFTPVFKDPIRSAYAYTFNTDKEPSAKQYSALQDRFGKAIKARIDAGVPEHLAFTHMNYDNSRVKAVVEPNTGKIIPMPTNKLPRLGRIGSVWTTPHYNIWKKGYRANAADNYRRGNLSMTSKSTTNSHEGILAFLQGHFGTQPYKTSISTYWPYVRGGHLRGLPYYSVNPQLLGGDPGAYSDSYLTYKDEAELYGPSKEEVGPTMKALLKYQPKEAPLYSGDSLAKENVANNYYISPVEFTAEASNIKTVSAGLGSTALNQFDADNPDAFVHALNKLTADSRAITANSRVLSHEGSSLYENIAPIFNRYKFLHDKVKRGERLSAYESNEYLHMKKALPSLWNQAKNQQVKQQVRRATTNYYMGGYTSPVEHA